MCLACCSTKLADVNTCISGKTSQSRQEVSISELGMAATPQEVYMKTDAKYW